MCELANVIMTGFLGVMAYKDWKTKKISVLMIGLTAIAAILLQIFVVQESFWSVFCGLMIGLLFLLLSKWTRESVGFGDSLLITVLGIYLGSTQLLEVMLGAGLGASIFAIWQCFCHGWNRKVTIPFVPFLAAAFIGAVFW